MEQLINLFKVLSDETRLRLMSLLIKRDFCVCELTEILEVSQPKISKHLSKLRDLGFVETHKSARFVYYRMAIDDVLLNPFLSLLSDTAESDETLKKDASRVPSCTLDNIIQKHKKTDKGDSQ